MSVFRELLQNADDAGVSPNRHEHPLYLTDKQAEHVQVKFYTQARLNALSAEKGGNSEAGPSRLPDAKKDNVGSFR